MTGGICVEIRPGNLLHPSTQWTIIFPWLLHRLLAALTQVPRMC